MDPEADNSVQKHVEHGLPLRVGLSRPPCCLSFFSDHGSGHELE